MKASHVCVHLDSHAIVGHLIYELDNYSFLFDYFREIVPSRIAWPGGLAALCCGPLEIDLHLLDGQLLGVGGYTNFSMWDRKPLAIPQPTKTCGLFANDFKAAQIGVGYTVDSLRFENQSFDPDTGWLCCGDSTASRDVVVEFATNCCAVILNEHIEAIWLHPENWESIATAFGK